MSVIEEGMSVIYWDDEPDEIETGTLGNLLRGIQPEILGRTIQLDTESSGLFVDGDWKDAPPARVSVVSLAWDTEHIEHSPECEDWRWGEGGLGACFCEPEPTIITNSLALPFDQGRIGGKPGNWSDELDGYEILPHTDKCVAGVGHYVTTPMPEGHCTCAPWNLNTADWFALCEWLTQWRIDFHNLKYDLHIMNAGLRTVPDSGINLIDQANWDSMLAQGIINPLETSSLKPTSERLFGDDSRDEERAIKEALKKNGVGLTWRYDLLAWDVMGPYASKDTRLTNRLKKWQQDQIDQYVVDSTDVKLIRAEFELAKTLFKMECRRFGFDIEKMRAQTVMLQRAAAELAKTLPFQPVNVNQAKKYFYGPVSEGGLGLTPLKVTDVCTVCTYNREKGIQRKNTKKPLCPGDRHSWAASLDTEVSARLAADKVPNADVWVQLAQIESALSKWYKAWPYKAVKTDEGWRLMTNFRQGRIESDRKGMTSGGAISGRLSAERIQAQGFPDDYKIPEFITPPKKLIQGKVAHCPHCEQITQHEDWELDISNAEVRVAAWLMQSPSLAKACATGNVHSANCRMMFGELLRATHPGAPSPDLDLETHPEWGMYRKIAKTTVLGLFFGAGIRTLRAQIEKATGRDFPESKVQEFKAMTLAVIPEWRYVSNRMQRKADKSLGGIGYIKLVNGRKRWFGWAERTHKAFNSGTQGGVAETMKAFMLWVEANYPGVMINQVHDSLWLELCPCRSTEVLADIQREGERLFTETFSTDFLRIPFTLDTKRLA